MRTLLRLFLAGVFAGGVFAQDQTSPVPTTPVSLSGLSASVYSAGAGYGSHPSLNRFYERTGQMHVNFGAGYVGSSLAYFVRGKRRLLYGANLNVLSVSTGHHRSRAYGGAVVSRQALLVPFWFTFKWRLRESAYGRFSPYVIGGLGPVLFVQVPEGRNILNSLTRMFGNLGGGAFLGIGLDYLWAEDWAFSADVRYNYFRVNHPTGLQSDNSGLSLFVGLTRAFGL